MRNTRETRRVIGLLACAALLIVSGIALFHSGKSKQTALTGRMTRTQMLSQSEPLLQALLVGAAAIETVAVPISTFDSTGQIVHHWNVDSTDPKTGNAAHLLWNADTDELVRVSQCRQNDRAGEYRDSSIQQDAVGLAWDWFHAMKMNRPLEDWHFIGARKKHFSEWDIYLRSGDRYTIMTIKTDTGQLVHALCGHLPSANMVWEPSKTRTDA